MHVLVTGATGFVGRTLVPHLLDCGHTVTAVIRQKTLEDVVLDRERITPYIISDLINSINWQKALEGVDAVIHLAARVHVLKDTSETESLKAFRDVNVLATKTLAEAAALAPSVKRFVYISSIKAVADYHGSGMRLTEETPPKPNTPYGISKLEAELMLENTHGENLEVVIIRPPLVYGEGAEGNLGVLRPFLRNGIPLPFASIQNSRSFISVDNLSSAIAWALTHPKAVGQTFHIQDGVEVGEAISTPEFIKGFGKALGYKVNLFPFPPTVLGAACTVLGQGAIWHRLGQSLAVDDSKIRSLLGWKGLHNTIDGLGQSFGVSGVQDCNPP